MSPPLNLNPASKWSEPIEVEGFTLFALHGPPSLPPNDSSLITVRTLDLTELKCPICLGYIKKSAVVHECLHRFCGDCIGKCLRVGIKECPSCRVKIASRRSLREDPGFDKIITSILGDIERVERQEEVDVEKANRDKNVNNSLAEQTLLGIQQQLNNRNKRPGAAKRQPVVHTPTTTTTTTTSLKRKESPRAALPAAKRTAATLPNSRPPEDNLVSFVLRKHPQETQVGRLDREYIRTSSDLKIYHLKKFLGLKLSWQSFHDFSIVFMAGDRGVVLSEDLSLEDVRKNIMTQSSDFVLTFKIKESA